MTGMASLSQIGEADIATVHGVPDGFAALGKGEAA